MAAGPLSGYLARKSRTRADLLTEFFAMMFISRVRPKTVLIIVADFFDGHNDNTYETGRKQSLSRYPRGMFVIS
jgi:hypothetical protein